MRRHLLVSAVPIASLTSACGSDDAPVNSTATAAPATSSTASTGSGTYAADAQVVLGDLGVAQRGLADAVAGGAPLSDAWKQAVVARVSAFGDIEARAQKLTPTAGQQTAQAQLLLAIRRSREAADTIATAVSEGNVSMLERANAILADAAFRTTATAAVLPR